MRKLFIILGWLCLIQFSCLGQTKIEIEGLIKDLTWESINYNHSYRTFFAYLHGSAADLLKIGKPASENLINSIEDPRKTAIIHIILTMIYEPEQNYFLHNIDIYKNCMEYIGWHSIFNNLVWERFRDGTDSIQPYQIQMIKLYWDKKIHSSSNPIKIQTEDAISQIHRTDAITYRCNDEKRYQNNSKDIKISDLKNLLNQTYPSASFDKVFKTLGRDYVEERYGDDLFYRRYLTDGLEFEFRNKKLTSIHFAANYDGVLFNKVKMTDNQDSVRKKLGKPEEFKAPRYVYDWYYSKFNIYIAFGTANRIIDLQLSNDFKY